VHEEILFCSQDSIAGRVDICRPDEQSKQQKQQQHEGGKGVCILPESSKISDVKYWSTEHSAQQRNKKVVVSFAKECICMYVCTVDIYMSTFSGRSG
jgi:type II secretory pathway component PulL